MRRLLIATLLVSAAAVGYELLLMRTLSIVQWHHFAWMIISLALLGYGVSGTFIAMFRERLRPRFEAAFALSALLFSVTTILCFALGQKVPFNALEVVWNPRQFAWLCGLYIVYFLPFFFAATCVGLALTFRKDAASRIYFFDLLGAGCGALLVIAALFALYPQDALLVITALALVASVLVAGQTTARLRIAAAQLAWILVLASGLPQGQLQLNISEYKGLSQALQVVDSRVAYTASSPLGLITVVESPTIPVRYAPGLSIATRHLPPEQFAVFTDADAMSAITRYDGTPESTGYLADLPAALPYTILDDPAVLILGAGTGSDVLMALHHGASRVDAVELNPGVSDLVMSTYATFAGGLYADPRVRLHHREARGYVRRSDTMYDLVQIGLLDSFGAAGAGVQSLNESYIYTVEAMSDYLDRTAPDGVVAITRWLRMPPRDNLKLIATAIEVLRRRDVRDPGSHLAVIRSWATSTLLIRRTPFTAGNIAAIREFARSRSFDTAWYPAMPATDANRFNVLDSPWLYEAATALLGDQAGEYIRRYKFDIAPATDDKPHFFHFFKWSTLPEVLALRRTGGAGLVEWGYLVLVATLLQAVLVGLLLILLPLRRVERSWPHGTGPRMGSYFLLLGLAFLLIEIAFIQKFILFLSHPLYAVAVVLSGFLVFAGVGSLSTGRVVRKLGRNAGSSIVAAVIAIAVLSTAYLVLLPFAFDRFAGLPDSLRIAISLVLIAPLAFAMGMPFPLGLWQLSDTAPAFIPWAWGINGFASVVGAALAPLLAIEFGFSAVILIAALLYCAAASVSVSGSRVDRAQSAA